MIALLHKACFVSLKKLSDMLFKEHKASLQQILQLVPSKLLSKLALSTEVNS